MATILNNTATINGLYNGEPFNPQTASAATDVIEMTVTKTASPQVWVGDTALTYTVAIFNQDTALPLTDLTLSDTLDPLFIEYVAGSAKIDGTDVDPSDVSYNETTGLLEITIEQVSANTTVNVTFDVTKK